MNILLILLAIGIWLGLGYIGHLIHRKVWFDMFGDYRWASGKEIRPFPRILTGPCLLVASTLYFIFS